MKYLCFSLWMVALFVALPAGLGSEGPARTDGLQITIVLAKSKSGSFVIDNGTKKHGADLNARDNEGKRPVDRIDPADSPELAELLRQRGGQ
jgi:hypothetical protein